MPDDSTVIKLPPQIEMPLIGGKADGEWVPLSPIANEIYVHNDEGYEISAAQRTVPRSPKDGEPCELVGPVMWFAACHPYRLTIEDVEAAYAKREWK